MTDSIAAVLMFLLGLLFLAAIGHVLWLLGAMILRGGAVGLGLLKPNTKGNCGTCAYELRAENRFCPQCGASVRRDAARADVGQPRLEVILRSLVDQGQLTADVCDQILSATAHAGRSVEFPGPATTLKAKAPTTVASPIREGIARTTPPPLPANHGADVVPTMAEPANIESTDEVLEIEEFVADEAEPVLVLSESTDAPAPTQRPFAAMVQTFLEERNIRWGELISGILIVGSAVGLVVSLWSSLKDTIPYFPALLFMLLTLGLFAAGMYTLHRWKLKSTSQGLLTISTLLVPLNFLAAIALSGGRPVSDPLYLLAVSVGLVVFSGQLWIASRVLMTHTHWLLPLAIMGTSAGQLYINRNVGPETTGLTKVLSLAVPLACFVFPLTLQYIQAARRRRMTLRYLRQIYLLLGTATLSLLLVVGLLVWKSQSVRETLGQLAPCFTLIATMIVAHGLNIHRRLANSPFVAARTTGTALGILGAFLMLAALGVGWPGREVLLATSLLTFVVLTTLAVAGQFGFLHAPALIALGVAAVVATSSGLFPALESQVLVVRDLADELLRGRSSLMLTLLAGFTAGLSVLLTRLGRDDDAEGYRWGSFGLAGCGLAIAMYAGFGTRQDASLVTLVFVLDAIACLALNVRTHRPELARIGTGLAAVACLHAFTENRFLQEWLENQQLMPQRPFVCGLVCHGILITLIALFRNWRSSAALAPGFDSSESRARSIVNCIRPLSRSALLTTGLVVPAVFLMPREDYLVHAGYAVAIAVVWISVAFMHRYPLVFAVGQLTSVGAVGLLVTGIGVRFDYWEATFRDSRHLEALLIGTAAWSLLCGGTRQLLQSRRPLLGDWTKRTWYVDRALACLLGVVVLGLATMYCVPGLRAEYRQLPGFEHVDAVRLSMVFGLGVLMLAIVMAGLRSARPGNPIAAAALVLVGIVVIPLTGLLAWGLLSEVVGNRPTQSDWGIWFAVVAAGAALLMAYRERVTVPIVAGLFSVSLCLPVLVALSSHFTELTATWLRWGLAVHVGVMLVALAECQHRRIVWPSWLRGSRSPGGDSGSQERPTADGSAHMASLPRPRVGHVSLPPIWRTLTIGLTLVSLFELSVLYMAKGPYAATASDRFTLPRTALAYAGPLLLVMVAYAWQAFRGKCSSAALTAGLCVNATVTLGYIVLHSSMNVSLAAEQWCELVEWNLLAAALFSIVWSTGLRTDENAPQSSTTTSTVIPPVLSERTMHLRVVQIGVFSMAALAALQIILWPGRYMPLAEALGSAVGGACLLSMLLAILADEQTRWREPLARWIFPVGIAGVVFLAGGLQQELPSMSWRGYHLLTVGWAVLAVVAAVTYWGTRQFQTAVFADDVPMESSHDEGIPPGSGLRHILATYSLTWTCLLAGVVLVVCLIPHAVWRDPARPWSTIGPMLIVTAAMFGLALVRGTRVLSYAAMLASLFPTVRFWLRFRWDSQLVPSRWGWTQLFDFIISVISISGCFWLAIDVYRHFIGKRELDADSRLLPVPHVSAGVGIVMATLLVGMSWLLQQGLGLVPARGSSFLADLHGLTMIGALGALTTALLWDHRARWATAALFAYGLVATAMLLNILNLSFQSLVFAVGMSAAVYVLLSGVCAVWASRYPTQLKEWLLPISVHAESTRLWLPMAAKLLSILSIVCELNIVWTHPTIDWRIYGSVAIILPALGLMLLSLCQFSDQVPRLRLAGCLVLTVAAAEFGWAVMDVPGGEFVWLLRAVRLLTTLSLMSAMFGIVLPRFAGERDDWLVPFRRTTVGTAVGAVATLLLVLSMEVAAFVAQQQVPVNGLQIAFVAGALVCLAVALVGLAVRKGPDPLGLSDERRAWYVYAAEIVLALLFVHMRLTMPQLFRGYLQPYWPMIVMAIAFFSSAVGEVLRRSGRETLSHPLQRTSILLPLLPTVGFWLASSNSDYSTVLFGAGLVYAISAMLQRSRLLTALAAVAGNAALWAYWREEGQSIWNHPQLWLIPPALSVLIAAHLNRARLSSSQLAAVRYLAISVIYVSSTGEMFLAGAGENLWLPMVLATLSVAGVLVGILLHIRAFLYLGSSFLMVSMISMVWHAARNIGHVWPWWAFGILLGMAILTLFGLFEKKRNDMLKILDEFRTWEK